MTEKRTVAVIRTELEACRARIATHRAYMNELLVKYHENARPLCEVEAHRDAALTPWHDWEVLATREVLIGSDQLYNRVCLACGLHETGATAYDALMQEEPLYKALRKELALAIIEESGRVRVQAGKEDTE